MKPSAARCLQRLRQAGGSWVSGNELAEAVGWRYSARLYELRAEGFTIERRSSRNGSAVDDYRIVEPAEQLRIAL